MQVERGRAGRIQGWSAMAIAALAAGCVVAAVALVGGPAEGRKERRNEIRYNDPTALSNQVACLAADPPAAMPQTLVRSENCIGPTRFADPSTGEDYRFEPMDDRDFRLCAGFEPDWRPAPYREAPDAQGCLRYRLFTQADSDHVSAQPVPR